MASRPSTPVDCIAPLRSVSDAPPLHDPSLVVDRVLEPIRAIGRTGMVSVLPGNPGDDQKIGGSQDLFSPTVERSQDLFSPTVQRSGSADTQPQQQSDDREDTPTLSPCKKQRVSSSAGKEPVSPTMSVEERVYTTPAENVSRPSSPLASSVGGGSLSGMAAFGACPMVRTQSVLGAPKSSAELLKTEMSDNGLPLLQKMLKETVLEYFVFVADSGASIDDKELLEHAQSQMRIVNDTLGDLLKRD
jgi:hypothetical protein